MLQTIVGEGGKVRTATICMYDGAALFWPLQVRPHIWTRLLVLVDG